MNLSVRLAVLVLVPGLAVGAPPAAVPTEPGVEWENTVEMQMAGFSMPAQTTKSCIPKKGMTEPPGTGKDDKCKVTRMKNDGRTMSWSMVCEGKDKMTGEGEIIQSPDGYDGKMTMRTAHGEMLMKMRGTKLGTQCDAGEMKRQVAAIQAQGAANLAKTCAESAQAISSSRSSPGRSPSARTPPIAAALRSGRDPRGRPALGAQPADDDEGPRLPLRQGLRRDEGPGLRGGGKGRGVDGVRRQRKPVLGFIGENCPAETQVVAQRECAGRTYTALTAPATAPSAPPTRPNLLDKGKKPATPTQASPEDAAQDAAKKAVKSLLPF